MDILVVDDERNIIELVRLYLEQAGYNVVEARDGHEALVQHDRVDPDLVVLDLGLPDVDGIEVLPDLLRQTCSGGDVSGQADCVLTYGMFAVPRAKPGQVGVLRMRKRVTGRPLLARTTVPSAATRSWTTWWSTGCCTARSASAIIRGPW